MRSDLMNNRAFTFIEIIIVCSIIVVLSAMLFSTSIRSKSKSSKAETMIFLDQIAAAINAYATDFGAYPPENTIATGSVNPVDSADSLWYHLCSTFYKGANSTMNAGPYLDIHESQLGTGSGLADHEGDGSANDTVYALIDVWGNDILYVNPGVQNPQNYDLYSTGPDGVAGNNDDIKNW